LKKNILYKSALDAAALIALALFLSACAGMRSEVSDREIDSIDNAISLGSGNITKYDDALYSLGQMLDAYGCQTVRVQVREIDNRTASKKLPGDVTQMTITALNKIGKHLQIIDYDQEQLGIDLAIGIHTMERVVPDLALRGAITEFDKKIEKERGLGLGISADTFGINADADADVNYDTSAAGITAAMDFQLIDYKTQTLISGIQAANRINLYNASKGGGLSLSFAGSGGDFSAKVKKTQGVHASLRLLVELSIAEIVGKYNNVPYWRCMPNVAVDPVAVRDYRRRIAAAPNRLQIIKTLATAHGCPVDLFSEHLSGAEAEALTGLRTKLNVPDAASDIDFITALWLTVPIEQGAENMQNFYARQRQHEAEQVRQREQLALQQQAEQERLQRAQQEAQQLESEKQNKRTTFKFGTQDSF